MAAPTNAADAKKTLANPEPSTHPKRQFARRINTAGVEGEADLSETSSNRLTQPNRLRSLYVKNRCREDGLGALRMLPAQAS